MCSKATKEGEVVRSAGGIVVRDGRILLVRHARKGTWGLPKGRVEEGEALEAAALREVLEEDAVKAELGEKLGELAYRTPSGRPKVAAFWRMTVGEELPFVPNEEIAERAWSTFAEAERKLSGEHERRLVFDLEVLELERAGRLET